MSGSCFTMQPRSHWQADDLPPPTHEISQFLSDFRAEEEKIWGGKYQSFQREKTIVMGLNLGLGLGLGLGLYLGLGLGLGLGGDMKSGYAKQPGYLAPNSRWWVCFGGAEIL